jgi:hypothetical protein
MQKINLTARIFILSLKKKHPCKHIVSSNAVQMFQTFKDFLVKNPYL